MFSSSGVRIIQSVAPSARALRRPLHRVAPFRQYPLQPSYARNRAFHATSRKLEVQQITSQKDFQTAVEGHEFVVLDAFADWCGPCKAMTPHINAMSNSLESVHFAKFDVDQLPELSAELGVRAMPTFLLFQGGKKIDELVGADPKALLKKISQMTSSAV